MSKTIKVICFYLVSGLVTYILYEIAVDDQKKHKSDILKSYTESLGTIEYVISGTEAFDMSIKYSYTANGTIYSRIIEVDSKYRDFYGEFIYNKDDAENVKLMIIYSNNDNSKSLVNLKDPIIEQRTVELPYELSSFK